MALCGLEHKFGLAVDDGVELGEAARRGFTLVISALKGAPARGPDQVAQGVVGVVHHGVIVLGGTVQVLRVGIRAGLGELGLAADDGKILLDGARCDIAEPVVAGKCAGPGGAGQAAVGIIRVSHGDGLGADGAVHTVRHGRGGVGDEFQVPVDGGEDLADGSRGDVFGDGVVPFKTAFSPAAGQMALGIILIMDRHDLVLGGAVRAAGIRVRAGGEQFGLAVDDGEGLGDGAAARVAHAVVAGGCTAPRCAGQVAVGVIGVSDGHGLLLDGNRWPVGLVLVARGHIGRGLGHGGRGGL